MSYIKTPEKSRQMGAPPRKSRMYTRSNYGSEEGQSSSQEAHYVQKVTVQEAVQWQEDAYRQGVRDGSKYVYMKKDGTMNLIESGQDDPYIKEYVKGIKQVTELAGQTPEELKKVVDMHNTWLEEKSHHDRDGSYDKKPRTVFGKPRYTEEEKKVFHENLRIKKLKEQKDMMREILKECVPDMIPKFVDEAFNKRAKDDDDNSIAGDLSMKMDI